MLTTEFSETKKAWIDLQQQVNYWKAQYAKATQREAQWKKAAQDFERTVKLQSVKIENLTQQVEELTAQVVWLKQRLFGRQTEQGKDSGSNDNNADNKNSSSSSNDSCDEKRSRGQQEGATGHGRKLRANLPSKGMFSVDFWVHILAEKFLFQRPMSRILQTLKIT